MLYAIIISLAAELVSKIRTATECAGADGDLQYQDPEPPGKLKRTWGYLSDSDCMHVAFLDASSA